MTLVFIGILLQFVLSMFQRHTSPSMETEASMKNNVHLHFVFKKTRLNLIYFDNN